MQTLKIYAPLQTERHVHLVPSLAVRVCRASNEGVTHVCKHALRIQAVGFVRHRQSRTPKRVVRALPVAQMTLVMREQLAVRLIYVMTLPKPCAHLLTEKRALPVLRAVVHVRVGSSHLVAP